MKKITTILILLLLISCSGKTVEDIQEVYPDGSPKLVKYYQENGSIRDLIREIQYYPNHKKYYEGEYKDNKKDGKWTVWYQSGSIWSEGSYSKGLDDGKRTGYYENGKKHFEGEYDAGKLVGVWKFWNESGEKLDDVDYNNN